MPSGHRVSVLLALPIISPAATPLNVGYQGRLMGADGAGMGGVFTVTFSLFTGNEDDTSIWTENQVVAMTDGFYAVMLGSVNPLPDDIFSEEALWLEVQVGSDPLLPRAPIVAVPFARTARSVSGGEVDASSIRIDGIQVIDSTGAFVGSVTNLTDRLAEVGHTHDPDEVIGSIRADWLGAHEAEAYLLREEFEQADFENLVANSSFERLGDDQLPLEWTPLLSGTSGVIAADADSIHDSQSVMLEDTGGTARVCLEQRVFDTDDLPGTYRGQWVTLTFYSKKLTGLHEGLVSLDDGGGPSTLGLGTNSAFERLRLEHQVSASANKLSVTFCSTEDDIQFSGTYLIDAVMLTLGRFAPPTSRASWTIWHRAARPSPWARLSPRATAPSPATWWSTDASAPAVSRSSPSRPTAPSRWRRPPPPQPAKPATASSTPPRPISAATTPMSAC